MRQHTTFVLLCTLLSSNKNLQRSDLESVNDSEDSQ